MRKKAGGEGRTRTERIPKIFPAVITSENYFSLLTQHFYSYDLLLDLDRPVAKLNPDPRPLDRYTWKGLGIIISILGSIIIARYIAEVAVDGYFVAPRTGGGGPSLSSPTEGGYISHKGNSLP